MQEIEFELRGEHITLGDLLKVLGLAGSGGAAKALIAGGQVQVDGQPETRRGAKLRAGQRVTVGDARVRVVARGTGSPR
jgi:ribosome-associated protein